MSQSEQIKTHMRDIDQAPPSRHPSGHPGDAMPMGRFKGLSASIMPTQYLLWVASQEGIRAKHPEFILIVLGILRTRLVEGFDALVEELRVTETPDQVWQRRKRYRAATKSDKGSVI